MLETETRSSPRTERKWAAGTHVLGPRQVIAVEYPHHYIHLTELGKLQLQGNFTRRMGAF
ncbi:hypothetical protein BDV33DRAFT_183269 [Aspergillus novoparasiticus]|uniref:Uncharacterized protein n=1 Tax=Aspergillus novoparasiticus TaxID=986946 RepID=A0A5N6EA35_9EURO|nr:hypothetical protein BDV33DRAFT_183269 [Aspergillus novoparasiticus]